MELTDLKKVSVRENIAQKMVSSLKPIYFLIRKKRKPWNITMESIRAMPAGTLGNDLYKFLHQNNLEIMPRAEFHDIYHVLFQYETNMKDETCIQFVPLGNGRYSLPYLISTFFSAIFYPEYWDDFYKAFQRGRKANKFHDWNFEPLLKMKTTEVRRMVFDMADANP